MLSDIENIGIMLGENHFDTVEREGSLNSNLARRPESANSNNLNNDDENMCLNPGVINSGNDADYGRNSASVNSCVENNRLSSELNARLSRELDEMMSSVNTQIQRAISDAISSQILPQIQNALNSGSGHLENTAVRELEKNSRNEPIRDRLYYGISHQAYDSRKSRSGNNTFFHNIFSLSLCF